MARSYTFPFDAKRSGETVALTVDFKNLLSAGETIQTAGAWDLSVKTPAGAALITASGSPTIDGTKVVQLIAGGADGAEYYLVAKAVTDGSQSLEQLCTLKVEDEEN
jgi:hypothetical protein